MRLVQQQSGLATPAFLPMPNNVGVYSVGVTDTGVAPLYTPDAEITPVCVSANLLNAPTGTLVVNTAEFVPA